MSDRQADTRVPIHPAIAARWSPRVFDPAAVVSADDITALLEAARWAATWGHRQPVRFVVGLRGDETFAAIAALLTRGNSYATSAGGLVLVCADEGPDATTTRYAAVDVGLAIAQLSIEAVSRSLVVHPMAGFDGDGARSVFGLPDEVAPFAVVAVGSLGDYLTADPEVSARDGKPRSRTPLEEVAFAGRWGTPFGGLTPG